MPNRASLQCCSWSIPVAELLLNEAARVDAADLYGYQKTVICFLVGGSTILQDQLIGDSILRNHGQSMVCLLSKVVYILDQVRALEEEMLLRIKQQGHTATPHILVVTRLIPDAKGTKCNQELKQISDTKHFQHPSFAIQDRERSCSEELDISF